MSDHSISDLGVVIRRTKDILKLLTPVTLHYLNFGGNRRVLTTAILSMRVPGEHFFSLVTINQMLDRWE